MTTVAVRGEAVREVDPELAEFTVVVSARDKDRDTTLGRLRERADALRQLLERFGEAVEKRETGVLHVYPEGSGKRGERIAAYNGSVSTTVTVTDFAALGEMMLAVAGQEQTQTHGPSWSLRPGSPVHAQLRRAAVTDAIARAREYADALGAEVVELVELADPGLGRAEGIAQFSAGYGGGILRSKSSGGGYADLQLDPQRQRVQATVEARFTITAPVL
ncbi:SIMPL domain-containing protein [Dactylosporangium matsuzakiense]|uniref:SIMPL domain-containing protein n=1 Tax=Dactylosporangium matsuzakiense TaxID=53360 RepID=UPI0021C2ECDA|nr:SIMPL domain-containing protein [Dactylosporangium matsuzakiense]UWZ42752.1 SIMPL domain-containing protein [Dactylosporangium matsuzakiense]